MSNKHIKNVLAYNSYDNDFKDGIVVWQDKIDLAECPGFIHYAEMRFLDGYDYAELAIFDSKMNWLCSEMMFIDISIPRVPTKDETIGWYKIAEDFVKDKVSWMHGYFSRFLDPVFGYKIRQ